MSKNKIKILFRHRSMEMGGVEKVMLSLLNNLDQEKFDMTVLLSLNQGELRDEIPNHVRKVWLADGREDMSKNLLIQKLQLLNRKRKLAKFQNKPIIIDRDILKDKYDIEIAMTYNDFKSVLNSTNKNSKKIGWFHSEINLPKLQPLVPAILDAFLKFDHIIYCSQRIKDLMRENYPTLKYPPESVIINAIPVEEILKKSEEYIEDFPEKNLPVFISIGRLHSRKGYHKLIEAHAELIQNGFLHKILILGDGEEKENLRKLIAERQVENTFILAGNRMNPYPYLKMADFFIMPSESEAWPLVLAEALVLQKLCIATDTGDVSTMLDNEIMGILINYNESEMYSAIKKFLTDKDLIAKMQKNLIHSNEKFGVSEIFKSIENIIETV